MFKSHYHYIETLESSRPAKHALVLVLKLGFSHEAFLEHRSPFCNLTGQDVRQDAVELVYVKCNIHIHLNTPALQN